MNFCLSFSKRRHSHCIPNNLELSEKTQKKSWRKYIVVSNTFSLLCTKMLPLDDSTKTDIISVGLLAPQYIPSGTVDFISYGGEKRINIQKMVGWWKMEGDIVSNQEKKKIGKQERWGVRRQRKEGKAKVSNLKRKKGEGKVKEDIYGWESSSGISSKIFGQSDMYILAWPNVHASIQTLAVAHLYVYSLINKFHEINLFEWCSQIF